MAYEPDRPDARTFTGEVEDIFGQFPVATWTVDDGPILSFPIVDLQEAGGSRIVRRKRPYRDGAKLDDTGREPVEWRITAIFNNSIEEPGLEVNNGPLYPNVLNNLIQTLDEHNTGDLVVPTRGMMRARLESYDRKESPGERDSALVTLTFVEDNEDGIDAASLATPTVNATAVRLAESTQFSAEKEGVWNGSLQDFKNSLSQLEGLINAPLEYVRDMREMAHIVMASGARVISTLRSNTEDTKQLFLHPNGNAAERNVVMGTGRARASMARARREQPPQTAVVFENPQSLASISAMLSLDYCDLLYANPQIENPLYIPAGTQVFIPGDVTVSRSG